MTIELFLLVHHGYDFDPQVLAICSSEGKAQQMYKEYRSNPNNIDFPWNGVSLVTTHLDEWVNYGIDDEERSLVGLAKQAGLIEEKEGER